MRLEPGMTSSSSVAPPSKPEDCPFRKLGAWGVGSGGLGTGSLGGQLPEGSTLGVPNQREIRTLERMQRGLEEGGKGSGEGQEKG